MPKTKLTIEVDPAQQQRLHDTCPELFAAPAPAKDVRDWGLGFSSVVRTEVGKCLFLLLCVRTESWALDRTDVRELRDHLTDVLDNA